MIKKYRKKPIVIEAVKWTGDNLREVIDFIDIHPFDEKLTWEKYKKIVKDEGLKIFISSGEYIRATIGDFISKDRGMVYPYKPDIFAELYEEVPELEKVDFKSLERYVK